jgi:GAF domain-containing protein
LAFSYAAQVAAGEAEEALSTIFSQVARSLLGAGDAQATLQRIVDLAVATIDSCEHAGISSIEGRRVQSPASSDEVPATIDRLQSETGEGPCLDAIRDHGMFETGHLSRERRWPNFVARASEESGIESILAVRLFVDGDTMGALNLYATSEDAFDEHDRAVATIFATHAAVALSTARRVENLQAAIDTRQAIGVATGLLMAREGISESEAFDVLRRASQRLNIKLRVVADRISHPQAEDPGSPRTA